MQITILGSGTGEPSRKRGFPGILLKLEGRSILIDSGSGTLMALLKEGVTYRDIDEIYYTHLHCDHVSELAPILFTMRNMAAPREKDLLIVGPTGFNDYYCNLQRLYDSTLEPNGYRISVEEVWESTLERQGIVVKSIPVDHTHSSVGYRFEEGGRSFVVSGDTGYCANIVRLSGGANLLALECSFPDQLEVEGHMTPHLAGMVASQAGVKKLLLTHFYPVCDSFDIRSQCKKTFSGEVILAADGMRVEV